MAFFCQTQVMDYDYDAAMEASYQVSFLKSFKRQIDDCYFNFIIVDAVFDKVAQLDEFWSYAMSKGFQASNNVYSTVHWQGVSWHVSIHIVFDSKPHLVCSKNTIAMVTGVLLQTVRVCGTACHLNCDFLTLATMTSNAN